ncbi:MAG TPA: ATP-dependent zinc metalloprotease FtsH [Chloroflexi bacterium]|jgi:cell division protease FtsH|nr:ATP-dependent zinc metalloprotease FtsH [Chloroflexota bacterium]
MNSDRKNSQNTGFPGGWLLLLIALFVAFNVWALWPGRTTGIHIPYSAFINEVRAGNVVRVRIVGPDINGTFAEPVLISDLITDNTRAIPVPGEQAGPQEIQEFTTTFPEAVGDAELMSLLVNQNVQIDVSPPPSPWLGTLFIALLPVILIGVFLLWARRQSGETPGNLLDFAQSKARRHTGVHTRITFDDVAGADEAKMDLQEVVGFLREPSKYHQIGAHIPRGVLLVGPPGTGKTLMARAVAGEANVPFFNINATEFVEMFVGVGASRVRDLFDQAKKVAPAILFIDELDAVGRRRGAGVGNVNDEREQTLNQLLVEMDGFDERAEVIVIAATNRPDVLDPALLRPGRFDRQVTVDLPDRRGRQQILKIHTQHLSLAPDVDLEALARNTTGFSGADLANLANEGALIAARKNHQRVTQQDMDEALDKILLGGERPLILTPEDREIVAYHEAGHALVAWLMPGADPVRKVTIIPHGRALGVTQQAQGDDKYNYSRTYLLARLSIMLGGRAAEEVALNDVTTGAEQDLVQASRLVRRMITQWGMGDLGLAAFEANDEQPFLGYELAQNRAFSEETAARIDRNVQSVLDERYLAVRDLVESARDRLDALVNALLENETVTQEQLQDILGPRPERMPGEAARARGEPEKEMSI